MSVTFNTSTYESSHVKKPRGFGSWAFGATPSASGDDIIWVHQAVFTAAKKQAAAIAASRGIITLHVLP
jgi:hypothetical protein